MKFYVTTPIYYVNDKPHIGHAYTTIAADILARYKRLMGYRVFFLTGTDEHGKKIEKAAEEMGVSPKELADETHLKFKELWKVLDISYDKFIRTTDPEHEEAVRYFWKKMEESGSIYKGKYVGWYCIPCESFVPSSQVQDGKCPNCSRNIDVIEEESYFFSVERYKKRLIELIEKGDFVKPDFRKEEVLNMIEDLADISISRLRERVWWGIPVPSDERFTIYVWVDALINYISALGYPGGSLMDFWPADVHIVGKDILKFHAIFWPMFLFSVGLEPPRMVFAHGWWKVRGEKMSKSLRNVVDPFEVSSVYGADTLRYFMFREISFGRDGDFSEEAISRRYENDLAKDFGNLVLRISKFAQTNFPGGVRRLGQVSFPDISTEDIFDKWNESMQKLDFSGALNYVFHLISYANRYIDAKAPWELIKSGRMEEAENVVYACAYLVKLIVFMLYPFCPTTCKKIAERYGFPSLLDEVSGLKRDILGYDQVFRISSTGVLFPKLFG